MIIAPHFFNYREGRIRFAVGRGGAVIAYFPDWGFSSPETGMEKPADALRNARAELVRHAGKSNAEEIAPVLEALDKSIEDALQWSLF